MGAAGSGAYDAQQAQQAERAETAKGGKDAALDKLLVQLSKAYADDGTQASASVSATA